MPTKRKDDWIVEAEKEEPAANRTSNGMNFAGWTWRFFGAIGIISFVVGAVPKTIELLSEMYGSDPLKAYMTFGLSCITIAVLGIFLDAIIQDERKRKGI